MNKLSFELCENDGTVELTAFVELTVATAAIFRSHLLKLLQHGRQKAYKLNLKNATAMDESGIELIYILNLELSAVNASLVIALPTDSQVKAFFAENRTCRNFILVKI